MKPIKLFLILNILLTILISVNASLINLNINEDIIINELGAGQVEIIATGTLNFENPTNNSLIYEYNFDFKEDINLQLEVNGTNISYSNKKIRGSEINPNENKFLNYKLNGIIPKTIYNDFYNSKTTLFEWYSSKKDFSPLRFATLNKLDKLKDFSNGTFERYVIIEGNNPSELDVEILYLNLFKTQSSNNISQIMNSQNLLETYENISLGPNQSFYFKTKDIDANDKTTYWIEYDIIAKINLTSKFIINYYSRNSGGSSSKVEDNESQKIIIEKPLIFKKDSNKNILSFTDDLNISLEIQNPNDFKISNLLILDEFNEYFDLVKAESDNLLINNNKLNFIIEDLLPFETKIINYNVKFDKFTEVSILYFPPSKLTYKNENIYSNSLNVINDIKSQDKRLFVQKEIEYLNSTTNRVYIKVKNIGDIDFENLLIVENEGEIIIDSNYDSVQKNKWSIPKLEVGSEWTTYYDVKADNVNKFIPEIYGAEDAKIYKTIVLNEKIDTLPIQNDKKTYQTIIVGIAIVLLIVDILF